MTKKRRKLVVLTSLMALLLTLFPIDSLQELVLAKTKSAPATINGFNNERCGYNPESDGPIPTHVRPCNDNNFKFNSKYYHQTWTLSSNPNDKIEPRNLIVYGDITTVSDVQSFKAGMQDANAKVFPNKGHFTKTVNDKKVYGEYRFLGYGVSGTLYPNDHFIRDSNDYTLQPVDKRWIYLPWERLPNSYKYKPGSPGGVYMGRDSYDLELDKIKINIDRSIGFRFADAPRISYADRDRILPREDKYEDVRNYMNIGQEPTVWEPGVGMMYHWHPTKKTLFYQSFPLLQLEPKEKKPTIAACEITPVSKKPIPLGKSQYVEVEVQVTGILKDESYIHKRDRETEFYTRKDVDYWKLDLTDPTSKKTESRLSSKPKDSVVLNKNRASHVFTIKVDTEKLNKTKTDSWTYLASASVSAYFANHSDVDPSYARENCQVNLKFQANPNSSMKSDFGIIPEIHLDNKSDFKVASLGYEDFSYGEDADYYEFVITNIDDNSKATKTFDPAIPEVKKPNKGYLDQDAVSQFLYEFMKENLPNETVRKSGILRSFRVSQTIVDKDRTTNNRSTATKQVNILLVPNTPEWSCEMVPDPPLYISPETDWALDWFDVVPFAVTDSAPDMIPKDSCQNEVATYDDFSKRVTIDDRPIDAHAFFKGEYIFGEELLGVRKVSVYFEAPDGTESHKTQHVVIHQSKPNVTFKFEGLFKQNRTMLAIDLSAESNDPWAEAQAPLETTAFSYVDLDNPNLKYREGYGENNKSQKMFMYKEPGNYKMSIAAKRVIKYGNGKTITRVSDPYMVDYEILPDHRPAIIAHTYSEQISRLDELPLFYDVQSTDGDYIASKNLQVFYDSKQDGSFSKKMFEADGDLDSLPVFDQLGQYKIVVHAKEGTEQDRLMEHITAVDDQAHTYEAFFTVDNYAPFSHMYLDIPVEMPEMDVYFMLDKNLQQDATDYIRGNKVTLTNDFTLSNMMANIGIWDMKTYTYSQAASTSRDTGTSYPSSTTTYRTADGYSGTLERTSVYSGDRYVDESYYVKKTDTMTGTSSCSNTVSAGYDANRNYYSSDTNMCPSSKSITSGNYSGTVYQSSSPSTSGSCPSDYNAGKANSSCSRTYYVNYSGTLTWTRDVLVPNMVRYDDYTGYYSGTIYKDVRQPYDASFMKAVKNKIVVYVTDQTISELNDLKMVMEKHDATLILVGRDTVQKQITQDGFIANEGAIADVVAELIAHIAKNNPAVPKTLLLVGDTAKTYTAQFDYENDALPTKFDQLQIVQDVNYFDNSTGFASLNGKSFIAEKNEDNWHPYQSSIKLNKPGKYIFYRKVKDQPSTDPKLSQFSYESNEAAVEVIVHRRPIADVSLDFDYLINANMYKTIWIDKSYDLDHNITRADTDRGIADRALRFMNKGTGEVFTKIPERLPPGTYILDYKVQDIEGEWSDPISREYILPDTIPVQMKSNLKTTYHQFSLNSVPASEQLTAFDMWTRYPYSISLALTMGSYINKTVPYYTGKKTSNDIYWKDEILTIPNTTPDGTYTFTIRGNGSVAGSIASQTYTVKVVTPINLKGEIASTEEGATGKVTSLVVNDTYQFLATTTKYPDASYQANATTVTLFKGTSYQKVLNMASATKSSTGYGAKDWKYTHKIAPMPNGKYTIEWRSTTPNGNTETVSQMIEIVNNRPPTANFTWNPQPTYEGDTVQFKSDVDDPDKDQLAVIYELTSPSGKKTTYDYTFHAPYPITAPQVKMSEVGSWTMKLTVSDGKAPPVTVTKSIPVLPLSVSGAVYHTEKWDEHRKQYNLGKSGTTESPRSYDTFWAGEKFILQAITTDTKTATVATRVDVTSAKLNKTISLQPNNTIRWSSELWEESFASLPDGAIPFTFTAYYSNGTIKTTNVTIIIAGQAASIAGVHRLK